VPTSDSSGFPTWFIVLFVVVAVIGIGSAIWRTVVLRKGGLNPFVAKEQLEVQLRKKLQETAGPTPTPTPAPTPAPPAKTIEERLAELDDLHERGVITAEERAAGRAKVIGGD
jgi:hypothetical protein